MRNLGLAAATLVIAARPWIDVLADYPATGERSMANVAAQRRHR
jgi:hypothetical protein